MNKKAFNPISIAFILRLVIVLLPMSFMTIVSSRALSSEEFHPVVSAGSLFHTGAKRPPQMESDYRLLQQTATESPRATDLPSLWQGNAISADLHGFFELQLTTTPILLATHNSRSEAISSIASTRSVAPQCSYCISPLSQSFTHESGNHSIAVIAPVGCAWTAVSNDAWITINSGSSGTGNGTVMYSVAANATTNRRTGSITVAGQNFAVVQGLAFSDVPLDHTFYSFIGKLSARGITLGCGINPPAYCPEQPVAREQMAAFIMRALGEFNPPMPTTQRFADVTPDNPFYAFIDRLAERGITLGCGGGNYCPSEVVTREQMAAFLVRALGEFNPPTPPVQRFDDVPPSNPLYNFIDRMAVLGITLGCSASPPLYCPKQPVTRGQMAAFLIRAFDQPINQPPVVSAGPDRAIMLSEMANLSGTVSDDGFPYCSTLNRMWSKVSGPGDVIFNTPMQAATTASFSQTGSYVLRLTASDSLLTAMDEVTVTVTNTNQAPIVNAGQDITITLPNSANLTGSATDDGLPTNTLTLSWSPVNSPAAVIFSHASTTTTTAIFSTPGVYTLRLTASDSQLTGSDEVIVTVSADPTPPPPDPMMVAPPVDMTVATTISTATEFLYTGANPIQTGVTPGTIKPMRAAVLRGRVLDKNDSPLSMVKVTVLNHPEFGQTLSRADGRFDMAVNGGGLLTVNYEKVGFLPVQRCENVPWQDYSGVPDVILMSYDPAVAFIDLTSTTPIQVAQSTPSTDSSGTRRTTFMFKQGTTATMKLPGGAMQGLDNLHVRATEFTVGTNGPNAMPGELPALSAYTFAAAFTVDEAVAANAVETTFNQPVVQYNENFLNFPVGTNVPSGVYDKESGIWMPSANGRIVKILSITGDVANLDVNGNGQPATDLEYAALGINVPERQQLAALYAVNQSLWRVPIIHFSAWDFNFGFGPPSGGGPPNGGDASSGNNGPAGSGGSNGCNTCPGSILGMQDQRLSEEVDVVGTPYYLRYDSTRPRANLSNYTVRIPLSGATLPGPVKSIEMTVSIAGQMHSFSFPAQANQITSFTWDGKDAYGRDVQGQQEITIDIGNVYDGVYQNIGNFGYNGNGVPITASATRQEVTLHRRQRLLLGTYSTQPQALGGWTLSEHHAYDPVGKKLYEGNGKQRNVQTVSNVINTFAGGLTGFAGDGGPVSEARFSRPYGIAAGPDGSIYVADSVNQRLRKIAPDGIVTTIAGNGGGCNPFNFPCGDGGPALNASFGGIIRVAVAPDQSIYVGGGRNVWRITQDGIIRRIAGIVSAGFSGDGGPARNAQLSDATRFYPAADGSVYISDQINQRIRRIDPNGIITTIAGTGTQGFSGDGGPATQAQISYPGDLVVTPDGNLYFPDQFPNNRIRRISPDGIITTIAGNGIFGNSGDGGSALQASFAFDAFNPIINGSMSLAPDGSLYVVSYTGAAGRIRRISPDGIVTAVAGNGQVGLQGDGGPALAAQTRLIAIGLAPDGSIYTVGGDFDFDESRIRRVSSPLPGFSANQIAIPSEDGRQLFHFDAQGRHLDTVNTLTGATIYTFAYNSAGHLISVTDGDNNITVIERDGSGNPTGIRSPYNQLTTFTRNANGYLASVTNPNNEQHQFTYNAGGQMTSETDPRNQQSQFTYDANGRLTRDDDPATGFQTLTRTGQDSDFTINRNTALNRQTQFRVQTLGNLDRNRINTFADGTQETLLERASGLNTFTAADGTITTEQSGGDPRWQLQAPLTVARTVTTPGGLSLASTFTRSVTLSIPANPLSLMSQIDTSTINGRVYTKSFDAATRTYTSLSPLNRQTIRIVDVQGRPTQFQFGGLNPLNFAYDARGRLMTATRGSGAEARTSGFTYNSAGFLASYTNPLNQTTSYVKDAAGRITLQTFADLRAVAVTYDANGNPTTLTPPSRPAHSFTYTPLNLLASYTAPNVGGNNQTLFTYNLDRQLTRITRPDALELNYAYDSGGRLQTLTVPNGVYTYSYGATTGRLTGISAPGGMTLAYTYDGSLQTRSTWGGVVAGNVSHTYNNFLGIASQSVNNANTINYTYDNDSQVISAGNLTLSHNAQNGLITGSTLGNVTDSLSYNGFSEPLNYTAQFNSTPLYTVQYSRDKLGRITQKVEGIGGTTTTYDYSYDLTGRLSTVTLNSAPQPAVTYVYDNNNNRTSITVGAVTTNATYDAQDRMTQYGSATYAYTANGELQSKTEGAQITQYGYDVLGNLRTVTLPSTTQIEYVIDGRDRRIGKRVNGTLTQGFLYMDQLRIVAELDGSNNLVSRFIYTMEGGITPDYMVRGGVTYRIISDTLGSVRLVVDSASGAIAQRLDYDEFGVVTMDTNPGFQPFGFASGLYDWQTGLVRFGARDYDARTGRWTTKDLTLFAGGDANLYAYVSNDPVNGADVKGQQFAGPISNFTELLRYEDVYTRQQILDFCEDPAHQKESTGSEIRRLNQLALEQQNRISKLKKELAELEKQKCPDQAAIDRLKKRIRNAEKNLARTKSDLKFLQDYLVNSGAETVEEFLEFFLDD
jgi:RHS repeat-associated protein